LEHATKTSYADFGIAEDNPVVVKGQAGSPYAIKDYYDIDPDLAVDVPNRMKEFEALVERTHAAGLKMVIDFVPNHVARQYKSDAKPARTKDLGQTDDQAKGFDAQNNFYYILGEALHTDFATDAKNTYEELPAKATGNDCFHAWPNCNDWYETVKLNYGVDYCGGGTKHFPPIPNTWKKMTAILQFWAKKGVDAFRCDMAEMVPVEFWKYAIKEVKKKFPAIQFVAEVYNPNEYRNYIKIGGFDYLYDKVGLYDTLRAIVCHQQPAAAITGAWQAVDDIHDHMLDFLENHDEQRIASNFFATVPEKAKPALIVSALMRENPLMIYAGQEIGEPGMDEEGFSGRDGRTTIFDYWHVEKLHKLLDGGKNFTEQEQELYNYYKKVLRLRNEEEAFNNGLFYDLMYVNYDGEEGLNPSRNFAFLRRSKDATILVVVNFDEYPTTIGVRIPEHAFEFLSLPEGTQCATDLLTDEVQVINLEVDGFTKVTMPSRGAAVLKF
jgi:glycosidase